MRQKRLKLVLIYTVYRHIMSEFANNVYWKKSGNSQPFKKTKQKKKYIGITVDPNTAIVIWDVYAEKKLLRWYLVKFTLSFTVKR